MSFTPEYEIIREYISKRKLLISSTKGRLSEKDTTTMLEKL